MANKIDNKKVGRLEKEILEVLKETSVNTWDHLAQFTIDNYNLLKILENKKITFKKKDLLNALNRLNKEGKIIITIIGIDNRPKSDMLIFKISLPKNKRSRES